jgi:hypothetical protein
MSPVDKQKRVPKLTKSKATPTERRRHTEPGRPQLIVQRKSRVSTAAANENDNVIELVPKSGLHVGGMGSVSTLVGLVEALLLESIRAGQRTPNDSAEAILRRLYPELT